MPPITDNERALLGHVQMFGTPGYPIKKLGRGWTWNGFGVNGPPVVFKTKTEATANFELWLELKRITLGEEAFERAVADRRAAGWTEEEIQKAIDAARAHEEATRDPVGVAS